MSHLAGRKWLAILGRTALALLVTMATLWILYKSVGDFVFRDLVSPMTPGYVAAILAVVVLLGWWRSLRLACVLRCPWSFAIMRISVLHYFMASIAPARLGELALPYLLRREGRTDALDGLAALTITRILDLLSLFVLGGASVALLPIMPNAWSHLRIAFGALAICCALALCLFPLSVRVLPDLLCRQPWLARRLGTYLAACKTMIGGVGTAGYVAVIAITSGLQLLIFFAFGLTMTTYGVRVDVPTVAACTSAGMLAFALPINGIANVGPFQAAWTVCLQSQGVGWSAALAVGIVGQLAIIVGQTLLSFLMWPLRSKTMAKP